MEIIEAIKKVKKKKRLGLKIEDWDKEDGLIYFKNKIFILKNNNLYKELDKYISI